MRRNYDTQLNFDWIVWVAISMIIFGISPLIFLLGLNLGNILLLLGGIFLIVAQHILKNHGKWFISSQSKRLFKRSVHMLQLMVIIMLSFFAIHAIIWNYFAYFRPPTLDNNATVVVLGCKIHGESPSVMLRRRLDAAITYLKKNPNADCVVSGGVGAGETFSEAYVMKKYMVENQIEESRIFMEEKSTNTATNLKFSTQIINDNNLSKDLVICTDGFHQLRGYLYAKRLGYESRALSCRTQPLLVPGYAVRELGGIFKLFVLEQGTNF